MRNQKTLLGSLLVASALFSGCYPEVPDYIDEYDMTYTNHSPSFDFQAANTYALPDSVVIVTGNLADGELPEMMAPAYGDQILGRIRTNLNTLGWIEVENPAVADVVVLASAVKTENVDIYYSYGGYYGWYYPYGGYGWYYPGYYPTYTSYTTGSLIIQMNVPSDPSPTNNVPVVWLSVFNGLLEGSNASIITRVNTSIDQAFKQSPYLQQ